MSIKTDFSLKEIKNEVREIKFHDFPIYLLHKEEKSC